jgi:hypothetical protein
MSAFTAECRNVIVNCFYVGHPNEDLLKRNSLEAEGCSDPHVYTRVHTKETEK